MAFNKKQFQDLIERVLKENDLYSPEIVQLQLGTAAQESKFGTYLRQLGGGPALGAFQMEEFTFNDLQKRFSSKFRILGAFSFEELEWNLKAAIIFCRIKYYSDKEPIPKTLEEQAAYYKRVYNTYKGKATTDEYIENYHTYIT